MWTTPEHKATIKIAEEALKLFNKGGMSFLEALGKASAQRITSAETLYIKMADVIKSCPEGVKIGKSILQTFGRAAGAAGPPIGTSTTAEVAAAVVAEATAPVMAGGGLLGALTTIGGWLGLSGTAATVAGGLVVTAVLGGITYVGANLVGSYAGERPVQPGPAMSRPASESPGVPVHIGGDRSNPPAAGAVTGVPDVSGTWKSGYDIVRDFTQSGNKITWSVDYQWGNGMRHEDSEGTVSDLSSGSAAIEVNITYTEPDGTTRKDNYTGTVSVDSDGKATRILWRNNDVSVRVQ